MVKRWVRGDRLELDPNPYYYGGAAGIRHLSIRFVGNATTALEMLRAGEADAYVNADDAQYDDLRSLSDKRTELIPIDGTGALIFKTTDPRVSDARVRRALIAALDRKSIVRKSLLGPDRTRRTRPRAFSMGIRPADVSRCPRTIRRAAGRLLDAAGWTRGDDGMRKRDGTPLVLDLLVRADKPSALTMATQIQAEERAIGVNIAIRPLPVTEYVAPNGPLYGGTLQLALFPFVAGFDPDVRDQFALRSDSAARIQQGAILQSRTRRHHGSGRRIRTIAPRALPSIVRSSEFSRAIFRSRRSIKPCRSTRSRPPFTTNEQRLRRPSGTSRTGISSKTT